jgi:hypothetical protein
VVEVELGTPNKEEGGVAVEAGRCARHTSHFEPVKLRKVHWPHSQGPSAPPPLSISPVVLDQINLMQFYSKFAFAEQNRGPDGQIFLAGKAVQNSGELHILIIIIFNMFASTMSVRPTPDTSDMTVVTTWEE